jgi:hypothetical protein
MSGFPIQAYRMMSKSPFGRRCVSAFGESSALISMPTCFSCAWSASNVSWRSWLPDRQTKLKDARLPPQL